MHSEYSLLDGACKIDALAARAAEFGQPALGLTDHGVMNGAVELYKACKRHGVKPIVGCEIYLVHDHAAVPVGKVERNHLTLLAATPVGYRVEIDGVDIGTRLFDPDVAAVVSTVAAHAGVRQKMVAAQRAIA